MPKKLIEPFIKYTTAGGLATLVHYAIFLTLMQMLSPPAWQATLLAASMGAIAAYILNYRYTFLSTEKHQTVLPKFLIVASLGVIIQTSIVATLSHWNAHYLLAQVIATGAGLIVTFLINSFWTFK